MAARSPEFGMNHPTVVPANFDPAEVDALATDDLDADRES
jgi:hypothetical protein